MMKEKQVLKLKPKKSTTILSVQLSRVKKGETVSIRSPRGIRNIETTERGYLFDVEGLQFFVSDSVLKQARKEKGEWF